MNFNGFSLYIMQSEEYANKIIEKIKSGRYTYLEDILDEIGCALNDLTDIDRKRVLAAANR